MAPLAIRVDHAGKKFSKSLKQMMLYGARDLALAPMGLGDDAGILRPGEFWALNDISFSLERGASLGIIGANGSGKTTLLRMLSGILCRTKGRSIRTARWAGLSMSVPGFIPC